MHSYATRLQIWINIMIIILVAKEEDYATHLQMLMQLLQMQVRAVTLDACLYAFHRIIHCSSLTICTSYDKVCMHFEELLRATLCSITSCMYNPGAFHLHFTLKFSISDHLLLAKTQWMMVLVLIIIVILSK